MKPVFIKPVYIKSGLTLLAIVIAVTAYLGWLDSAGERYAQQGLKRTLITYGVARGLNGVISVAQGTELAFEPVGVGLTFTPGQILDPVNDLVERFSWVVLASGASLGVQNVLIQITSWPGFSALIMVFLLVSIALIWHSFNCPSSVKKIIYKVTLVLMIIRFAIPVIAIINEALYMTFLEPQYIEAKANLQQTADDIENLNEQQQPQTQNPDEEISLIDKVKNAYHSATEALDVKSQLDLLKVTVADVSENALNMIVVFVIQTLVFPLLFLWLTLQLIKYVIHFKPIEYKSNSPGE